MTTRKSVSDPLIWAPNPKRSGTPSHQQEVHSLERWTQSPGLRTTGKGGSDAVEEADEWPPVPAPSPTPPPLHAPRAQAGVGGGRGKTMGRRGAVPSGTCNHSQMATPGGPHKPPVQAGHPTAACWTCRHSQACSTGEGRGQRTREHTHTDTRSHAYTDAHACTHARMCALTQTHTQTHAHNHTQMSTHL